MLGVNVRICTPKSLNPKEAYVDIAKEKASQYGGSVMITDNMQKQLKIQMLYIQMFGYRWVKKVNLKNVLIY